MGAPAETIRVGVSLSLSGRFSAQGQETFRGLRLWVEDANQAGGIGGKTLQLITYDDGGQKDKAVQLTERLIREDRVHLLMGPYSSLLTLAVAPLAEREKKILWNHGGASDEVFKRRFRYVVGLLTPASQYLVGVLQMIRTFHPSTRRVALLHAAKGTFPAAVAEGALAAAREWGFQVVYRASYPPSVQHFTPWIEEMRAHQPEVILGVGPMEQDVLLARQLRSARLGARAMALVAVPVRAFQEALGDEANGFMGPSQWEPGLRFPCQVGPSPEEFSKRFRERFGVDPDYPAAQGYAAGLVARRCVEVAGGFEADRLREAAASLEFTTLYGPFKIDPRTGVQTGHPILLVQWQGGRKVIVWPPSAAEAPPLFPPL